MNSFEERRQARIDRIRARAEKMRKDGERRIKSGDDMLGLIPLGQPILVGHHSEKRDRRYRARAFSNLEKGNEMVNQATRLEERAEAAENNKAIFSDDPNAAEKIEEKIERLEKRQRLMVAANKCVRKNDRPGLVDLGFSESSIEKLFHPDFCNRLGFPNYALTNNSANIRRLKMRLEEIEKKAGQVTKETMIGDIRVVENVEENRLQLFFPEKPSMEMCKKLKQNGFHFSFYNKCWQRLLNGNAIAAARYVLGI